MDMNIKNRNLVCDRKAQCLTALFEKEKKGITTAIKEIKDHCGERFEQEHLTVLTVLLDTLQEETIHWIDPFKNKDEIHESGATLEEKVQIIEDYIEVIQNEHGSK